MPANPDATPENTDTPTVPPQVLKAASQFDNFAFNAVRKTVAEVATSLAQSNKTAAAQFIMAAKDVGLAPESHLTPQVLSDPDTAWPLARAVDIGLDLSDEQWRQAHAIALHASRKRRVEKASGSQPLATRHCGLAIQKPCEDVSEEEEAP